ncbi:MAG: gamma-glutamyltransferase [Chloroflexi bacterium]|nr:gamma-glutamyltransferase [Chloroflexota bacterium]
MAYRPTVRAANGAVATGHHLATEAGIAALRDGGSAVDAAIAAAAVCAVTKPSATSIGGDVFALVYDARQREVIAYNGSGAAPRSIDVEALRASGYPTRGAVMATVPGCVAGWGDMLAAHGRLGLDRVLAPAIAYAEDGFPVSPVLSSAIAQRAALISADPECARIFMPRGRLARPGEMLQQPDLAWSLREIARDGADAFYRGAVAERLAEGIALAGGSIGREDLASHRTDTPEPISVEHRGLRVYGQPPVSQGHILLEEIAIADGLDLVAMGWGSAELVHTMVEIKKLAFADRDAFSGDPRHVDFEPRRLFDHSFVAQRRKTIRGHASERADAGELAVAAHTTYLAVADRDGNVVSLIESVFSVFGSATVVPGTGILLNDRLRGFSLHERSPNTLAPGRRPVHTLNTVIALDGSTPRFVFGTPGAQAQVQSNFQLAAALIDFGMDVQEAIEAPRWYHESGRTLKLEGRFPEDVRRTLAGKGHEIDLLPDWDDVTGGAQAIAVGENGVFSAGADPRREGVAAGY